MPYMKNGKEVFSKKEKAQHLFQKTKKGAKSNDGNPLSDFQRGRNFGRAEEIGKEIGRFKYHNAKKKYMLEGDPTALDAVKAKNAEYMEKKKARDAEFKAKKAGDKVVKKGGKKS